jgi:hypothetical protein
MTTYRGALQLILTWPMKHCGAWPSAELKVLLSAHGFMFSLLYYILNCECSSIWKDWSCKTQSSQPQICAYFRGEG